MIDKRGLIKRFLSFLSQSAQIYLLFFITEVKNPRFNPGLSLLYAVPSSPLWFNSDYSSKCEDSGSPGMETSEQMQNPGLDKGYGEVCMRWTVWESRKAEETVRFGELGGNQGREVGRGMILIGQRHLQRIHPIVSDFTCSWKISEKLFTFLSLNPAVLCPHDAC